MAASTQSLSTQVSVSHDDTMADAFREDPDYAEAYLNSVLEDGEPGELRIALRQIVKAFGGIQDVAEKANLSPEQIDRTLSIENDPDIPSLRAILKATGFRLSIAPMRSSASVEAIQPGEAA